MGPFSTAIKPKALRIAIIIGVRFEFNAGWNETGQEVDRERATDRVFITLCSTSSIV